MTASPLETRLTRYAAGIAAQGREAAGQLRTVPLADIDDYQVRLAAAERHLVELLLAVGTPDYEMPADEALLDLGEYTTGRQQPRDIAKRWARTACRGHSWSQLTANVIDTDALTAAVEAAGIEPERLTWAPGLTVEEARIVCATLGLPEPDPLADIDARLAESVAAAAGDW